MSVPVPCLMSLSYAAIALFSRGFAGGEMAQEVRADGCRFDPTLGVSKCP